MITELMPIYEDHVLVFISTGTLISIPLFLEILLYLGDIWCLSIYLLQTGTG